MTVIVWRTGKLAGFALAIWAALATALFAQSMRVHFVDVGQGDATLIEFPCAAMLIDTGGEKNSDFDSSENLVAYLDNFFARRTELNKTLSLLVLTHPHIDHTRGVKDVLARYRVLNAVTNGTEISSGRYGQIALHKQVAAGEETSGRSDDMGYIAAAKENIPRNTGLTNNIIDPVKCDAVDPKITLLWGAVSSNPGWRTLKDFKNENNHSAVIRIDFGRSSILFTGDLEEAAIPDFIAHYSNSRLLDVDVYKVGHHGSHNGTTAELLAAMTPDIAVLSMGSPARETQWTAWAYGHPRKATVDLLQQHVRSQTPARQVDVGTGVHAFEQMTINRAIYGTGWEGTVVLEGDLNGTWRAVHAVAGAVASSGAPAAPLLNINTATAEELTALPMIGPSRAAAIVEYRGRTAFQTVDDLLNVRGIGPGTVSAVRHLVTAGTAR